MRGRNITGRVHSQATHPPSTVRRLPVNPDNYSGSVVSRENKKEFTSEGYEQLIDAREAAELLSCSRRTVKRLAEQGQIPAMRIGNRWRFSPCLLARWCHERLSSNTAQPVSEEREGL
jgi:excisionase family DNA binding protein